MRTAKIFATLVIAATVLWLSLVVLNMSAKGVWCFRTRSQIHNQCQALVSIADALNEANVSHWLCYGSALAATRGLLEAKDAWPIPWESDDDLCVFAKDARRIEMALHGITGGEHTLKTQVLIGNVVRYRVTRMDNRAGEEWKTDIYAHTHRTFFGNMQMIQNTAPNRDRAHRDFPAKLIEPLRRRQNYCGSNSFSLPRDYEAYASHLFGSTWKTPIASFTGSNGYRRLTCVLAVSWQSIFGIPHQNYDSEASSDRINELNTRLRVLPQPPGRKEDT